MADEKLAPAPVQNIVLMQMTPMELAYQFSCVQLAESKLLACPHAEQIAMNAVYLSASMIGRQGVASLLDRLHAGAKALAGIPSTQQAQS